MYYLLFIQILHHHQVLLAHLKNGNIRGEKNKLHILHLQINASDDKTNKHILPIS